MGGKHPSHCRCRPCRLPWPPSRTPLRCRSRNSLPGTDCSHPRPTRSRLHKAPPGPAAIIATHPNVRDADVVSEREAFTWHTFNCTDKLASLHACTHATLGMATAVRTHGKPRHGGHTAQYHRGRTRALLSGCRLALGWSESGLAIWWSGWLRAPLWLALRSAWLQIARASHVGTWGGWVVGKGNEWSGGHADLEVVLGVGSGTWQHWQQFRPSPPQPPLRLHKPHRPLSVTSVTGTSVRMDHGPSSQTR